MVDYFWLLAISISFICIAILSCLIWSSPIWWGSFTFLKEIGRFSRKFDDCLAVEYSPPVTLLSFCPFSAVCVLSPAGIGGLDDSIC